MRASEPVTPRSQGGESGNRGFPATGWCNRGPVLGGTDPRLGRHSLTLGHFGVKASPLGNRGFAAMLRGNDMDIDFVGLDLFLPERVVPDRLKTKTTKTL